MHLRDPVVVLAQEAHQDLGIDPARIGVDPAHDPEVERDDRAVRPELQVALVHVGMKEAVAQRVGQEGLDHPLGQPHEVDAGRRAAPPRRRGRRPPPIPASAPAAPRRARSPPAPGSPGRRAVFAANSAAAAASIRRSSSPCTTPSKCAITARGRSRRAKGASSLDHVGGEVEGVDVAQEGPLDPGPQHLHRHRLPGLAQRRAGAPGRARRRRPAGRTRRRPPDRQAELVLHRRPRLGHREFRQLVLQHRQLAGELRPDDVRPGRQELAELDVGRPERGQRPQDRRLGRVARVARATGTASRAPAPRPGAPAARRAPRAPRPSPRSARRSRRCGSAARDCAGRARSELPARMQRGDAHREVAVAHLPEARRADHRRRRSPGRGSGGSIPTRYW